jgi:hypothetical protein
MGKELLKIKTSKKGRPFLLLLPFFLFLNLLKLYHTQYLKGIKVTIRSIKLTIRIK